MPLASSSSRCMRLNLAWSRFYRSWPPHFSFIINFGLSSLFNLSWIATASTAAPELKQFASNHFTEQLTFFPWEKIPLPESVSYVVLLPDEFLLRQEAYIVAMCMSKYRLKILFISHDHSHYQNFGSMTLFAFMLLGRGVARIFQRGGQTVSKWGYSLGCHVDLDAVFRFNVTCFG